MIIIVDANEKATNPKVVRSLKRIFPKLQIESLGFGDLNVILDNGEMLSIERKRATDFLGSIGDGRVFRQVEAMSKGAKWCCIIIEGTLEDNGEGMILANGAETNWKSASVRGAMLAITWSGCPIIHTDEGGYANAVLEIIKFCSKPDVHRQALGRHRIVTFPPISVTEELLAGFPGIGLKRARSLSNFTKDMNKGIPSFARAIAWATRLPQVAPKSRPEGWGDKVLQNFITALGLNEGDQLTIIEKEKKHVRPKRNSK